MAALGLVGGRVVAAQRQPCSTASARLSSSSRGGIASLLAGHIVTFDEGGRLQHFDAVGYVVIGTSLLALALLWRLHRGMPPAEVKPAA